MEKLRMPFFAAALACLIAVVLIEIGSGFLLKNGLDKAESVSGKILDSLPASEGTPNPDDPIVQIREALGEADESDLKKASGDDVPGLGIPYMAILDGVLLFTQMLGATSLIFPKGLHARLQGCVSCFVGCMGILGTIIMLLLAFALLLLMIALLLAIPFGTIAYMALYGFFNTGSAAAVLTVLLSLKIAFLVLMVLANQLYLRNCMFLLMTFSSIVANILLSILHGVVPVFLVSITDAIGALIVGICGLIWLLMLLIGGVMAVITAMTSTATDL